MQAHFFHKKRCAAPLDWTYAGLLHIYFSFYHIFKPLSKAILHKKQAKKTGFLMAKWSPEIRKQR